MVKRRPKEDRTILLVEDSADDATLILRALKQSGIANRIVIVHDGIQALDYLFGRGDYAGRRAAPMPVVVLLDLNLPKIGGLEVLKRMRADERTAAVPVVIVTSSDEEQDIVEAYRLGTNSYVRKPVGFTEFGEAVRRLGLYWQLLNEPPPDAREATDEETASDPGC